MSPLTSEDISEETKDAVSDVDNKTTEKHPFTEIIQFALLALIIVMPIRFFIAQPFIVSGASMESTFHTNEYLIVDQISYYFNKPERGDVIIFRYPKDPSKYFIKRIIGLPGDTLDINGNIVTITLKDGEEVTVLDETYVKEMSKNTFLTENLGEREYFVMGDNRDYSSDSRSWGVLQEENIIGRAFVRLFPFSEIGILPGKADMVVEEIISDNK